MAYIGKQPVVGNFQVCDAISVVNGQAAYTMQVGSANVEPENANHMLVSLNGVLQKPGSSFTISGATITFASNLVTNDVIGFIILLGDTLSVGTPSDDSVGAAQIKNDLISGTTALTAEPADTDEFLVSDAGNLKRIDYSLIKGGGITVANQWRYTGGESLSAGSTRELINNLEEVDTAGQGKIGTSMSVSSGVWTFPSTGIYLVQFNANFYSSGSSRYVIQYINVTTNNSSFTEAVEAYSSIKNVSSATYQTGHAQSLIDVTDTANVKVKFAILAHDDCTLQGDTDANRTYVTFTRLGDT